MSVLGMALAGGADYDAGHPPGQRRRRPGSREDRRRHGDARRNPARPAAGHGQHGGVAPTRSLTAAIAGCTSSTLAAGWASASSSPTAASMCCTPATCSICRRPAPRATCWSSASTATPACGRSRARRGRCNREAARAQVLAGLQAVDYVTVFDEATPLKLIQAVRPDVLVKGADYRGEDVVGGRVRRVLRRPGLFGAVGGRVFDDEPY